MKDQYVGDIGDFEKYSVLQELGRSCGLPLVVCWMLTAPDTADDGAKVEYLMKPERYRHLNPYVLDRLASIVRSEQRSTHAIEEVNLLEGAQFVGRRLEDDVASRVAMFHELWEVAGAVPSLVFFDPDIGLEVKSVLKGRKRSAMYLYRDEMADAFKSRRGSLEHLGALAAVKFTDDGQIREVINREERAQEPKYQIRLWRLDKGRA